jgi:hypothetical protein
MSDSNISSSSLSSASQSQSKNKQKLDISSSDMISESRFENKYLLQHESGVHPNM